MLVKLLSILCLYSIVVYSLDQPQFPSIIPYDNAYTVKSISCPSEEVDNWSCIPCQYVQFDRLLVGQLDYGAITVYYFLIRQTLTLEMAVQFTQSQSAKYQELCLDNSNTITTINVVSDDNTCTPGGINIAISTKLNNLISLYGSLSTQDFLVEAYDTFLIIRANEDYQFTKLEFTGYEIAGSIAELINSYMMVKTYQTITIVSLTGCYPTYFSLLNEFGSYPKMISNVKNSITTLFRNSPFFSQAILNTYWTRYNIVMYKDPLPQQILNNNVALSSIQTVYYNPDGSVVGVCEEGSTCDLQSPPLSGTSQFILNNHYSIFTIDITPIISGQDECNLYPTQLRDYIGPNSNYYTSLCNALIPENSVGSPTTSSSCSSNLCNSDLDSQSCLCNTACSFITIDPSNIDSINEKECCFNICTTCQSDLCSAVPPPPPPTPNAGLTCVDPVVLPPIPNDYTSVSTSTNTLVINPYNQANFQCSQFSVLPNYNVFYYRFAPSVSIEYRVNVFSSIDTQLFVYSSCDISTTTCVIGDDNGAGQNNPFVITPLIKGFTYIIIVTTKSPIVVGTFIITIQKNPGSPLNQIHSNEIQHKDESLLERIIDGGKALVDRLIIEPTNRLLHNMNDDDQSYNSDTSHDEYMITEDNKETLQYSTSSMYSNHTISFQLTSRLPGSCVGKCGGKLSLPGICRCNSDCDISTDYSCCADICSICTLESGAPNEYCLRNDQGTYSFTCQDRCDTQELSYSGCQCNPVSDLVNLIVLPDGDIQDPSLNRVNVQCLDYVEKCVNIILPADPKYTSCANSETYTNRCNYDTGESPDGPNEFYTCSCKQDIPLMGNQACGDINTYCNNTSLKPVIQKGLTCFVTVDGSTLDYCDSSPPGGACGCTEQAYDSGNQCSDFCRCDIVTQCDEDKIITLPPTSFDQRKYYSLAISPQCSISSYQAWTCKSCRQYSGYTLVASDTVASKFSLFIHQNSRARETLVTLSNKFESDITSIFFSPVFTTVSYDQSCLEGPGCYSQNITLEYSARDYRIAMTIKSKLESLLGGFINYFARDDVSKFTMIAHGFSASIMQIIYNEIVLKDTVVQYKSIWGNNQTPKPNSIWTVSQTGSSNVIIQGITVAGGNILHSLSTDTYNAVVGPNYDGLVYTDTNYRMFGYVNSFDFYSAYPISNPYYSPYFGLNTKNFQTYYLESQGGDITLPCYSNGNICFSLATQEFKNKILAASLFGAISFGVNQYLTFRNDPQGSGLVQAVSSIQNLSPASVYERFKSLTTLSISFSNLMKNLTTFFALNLTFNGIDVQSILIDSFALFTRDLYTINQEHFNFFDIIGTNDRFCKGTVGSQSLSIEEIKLILKEFKEIMTESLEEYNSVYRDNNQQLNNFTRVELDQEHPIHQFTILFNSLFKQDNEPLYKDDYYNGNRIFLSKISDMIDNVNGSSSLYLNQEQLDDTMIDNSLLAHVTTEDTLRLIYDFFEYMTVLEGFNIPVKIAYNSPTIEQYDKYSDLMSIGFAPYQELNAYNCSICNFYKTLGYQLLKIEYNTYYNILWLVSDNTKEIIILVATDNNPNTIHDGVCDSQVDSYDYNLNSNDQSTVLTKICWPPSNLSPSQDIIKTIWTNSTINQFPKSKFTPPYLNTDYTAELMVNPLYDNYYFTYLGFGSASSKLVSMYTDGVLNYNNGTGNINNCPQNYVQLVLFSPLSDWAILQERQGNSANVLGKQVTVFINPCDIIPIINVNPDISINGLNPYTWFSSANYLNAYTIIYSNNTRSVANFVNLPNNIRRCESVNNTNIQLWNVYPAHFEPGDVSSIYGYLRNADQLTDGIEYQSVTYNNPNQLCPLLSNYPTNEIPPSNGVATKITQPPAQNQLEKYYKLNLLSYSNYEQAINRENQWWNNNDLKNYTIIEKLYDENYVYTAYYSVLSNEVILSVMARNDTTTNEKYNCNESDDIYSNFAYNYCYQVNHTICNFEVLVNEDSTANYYAMFQGIMLQYYSIKASTVTFTGIGLGAAFHRTFLLETIQNHGNLFGIPSNTCIEDYGTIDRLQSLFFSPTRQILTFFDCPLLNLPSFLTSVFIVNDANYLASLEQFISFEDYQIVVVTPSALSPTWVYQTGNNPFPTLVSLNQNEELTNLPTRFYNTYYGLESPYAYQSNWEIILDSVGYIAPVLVNPNMYTIEVTNPNEACSLLTTNINVNNNTLPSPPTIVQNELYSYFSMLAYCSSESLVDRSCPNLFSQDISPEIYASYGYFGSDEFASYLRVISYISVEKKDIIYAFAFNSTDEALLDEGCTISTTGYFEKIPYDLGFLCTEANTGQIWYNSKLYPYYRNWDDVSNWSVEVFKDNRILYPDYTNTFVGNSLGGSIAQIAYMDNQMIWLLNRQTCAVNPIARTIAFGPSPSYYVNKPTAESPSIVNTQAFSIINQCDAIPYLYPNDVGYDSWLEGASGTTYTVDLGYNLSPLPDRNPSSPVSLCPSDSGYNIDPSNRLYFRSRSFIGYGVNNVNGIVQPLNFESDISEEYIESFRVNNFPIISTICSSVRPNNVTTRIDWTGPTQYQLERYNKLMSYSYYPNQPMSRTVTPNYINPTVYQSIINDPQITNYIDVSGSFIIGFHKIVYYVNYQIKELVISIVPVNTTDPYKAFTCRYPRFDTDESKYKVYGSSYGVANLNTDAMMLGQTNNSTYNLIAISTKIRYIQQQIFEQTLLSGHGPKSDWTFTLISKDTGNNAALNFLFEYYYSSIQSELVGGIQRYKIANTGYKILQQLGFGNLLDKMIRFRASNTVTPTFNHRNYIGKNIFMTVSLENDLLDLAYKDLHGEEYTIQFGDSTFFTYIDYFGLDKWHRNLVYSEGMTRLSDNNQYKCNKYYQYVKSDGETIDYSTISPLVCGLNRTIKKEYFRLPNYFYRYSVWDFSGTYLTNYPGPFIQYNDPSYDICTAD